MQGWVGEAWGGRGEQVMERQGQPGPLVTWEAVLEEGDTGSSSQHCWGALEGASVGQESLL